MTLMDRGQVTWLRFAGKPTRRVDAPLSVAPVQGVRLIAGVESALLHDLRFEGQREHLVIARDALADLEHGAVVVHDGVRCRVQAGPIPVPPDGGLVAYPIIGGD